MARLDQQITSPFPPTADVILIGAGLANSILAVFLRERHPELKVLMFEKSSQVHRSKTWCFHETDVSKAQFETLKPLLAKSWPGYEVQFPNLHRTLETAYHSIQPETLEAHLRRLLGADLHFQTPVQEVSASHVKLNDGSRIEATCIIDGRGFPHLEETPCGYQKFVGLHLELESSHGLKKPLLMDATIPQLDGYRFFYVLPWSDKELLIEDTRYSSNPDLQVSEYCEEIKKYALQKNWLIKKLRRVEEGVLPIPLQPLKLSSQETPRFGTAGGFFHPITGYSLPDATMLADQCSSLVSLTSQSVIQVLENARKAQTWKWKYLCLLNRMMFEAAKPEERYRIFERFYSLNKNLIGRFYSGNLALKDQLRIVMGAPPVPIFSAVRCVWRPTL